MQSDNIVIIDYGLGNLRSVKNRFNQFAENVIISRDINVIRSANKLILPGVGSFKKGMENLRGLGLLEVLNKSVLSEGTPIMGICLGMQLFANYSEEGDCEGLGWIDARVNKLTPPDDLHMRIPHYGWNTLKVAKNSQVLTGLTQNSEFYFVHSYCMQCNDKDDILTNTLYGENFTSSVLKKNIFGVQFHPEKSYTDGEIIIENFLNHV